MSEPTFETTTERLYNRLPGALRTADRVSDYALKKYISSLGDIQSDVDTLVARFGYEHPEDRVVAGGMYEPHSLYYYEDGTLIDGDDSDLVSAERANPEWLRWLGQLVGVDTRNLSEEEARQAIGSGGFQTGSKSSIGAVVKSVLSDSKYSRIYPNSNDTDPIGEGTEWEVLVVTKFTETPGSSADLIDVIERSKMRPAGVVIFHKTYASEWQAVEAAFPTWADWEGQSWATIEEAGFA